MEAEKINSVTSVDSPTREKKEGKTFRRYVPKGKKIRKSHKRGEKKLRIKRVKK